MDLPAAVGVCAFAAVGMCQNHGDQLLGQPSTMETDVEYRQNYDFAFNCEVAMLQSLLD